MNLLKSILNLIQFAVYLRRLDASLVTKLPIAYLEDQRRKILSQERYQDPKRLNKYEYQVFSQNGEDGIIAEIFSRVGVKKKTFLEIGVGKGLENNTVYLLFNGWSGFWIDGHERSVQFINKHFESVIRENRLVVRQSLVTAESIDDILEVLKVPSSIDLLSIDIDRNTYWILNTMLTKIKPRVFVTEYNALIPPDTDWKVKYSPTKTWNGTTYSGASLLAYEKLGKEQGYALVGCDICGINAFFVREDVCQDYFLEPFSAQNHYEPLRDYLVHRVGYQRAFGD